MFRDISLAIGLLALLAISGAVIPFLTVAKWVGHFPLTVRIDATENVDLDSVVYLPCNREEATYVLEVDGVHAGFEPPDGKLDDDHIVGMMCMGDSGGYGLYDTYHQPDFLVVEFRMLDAPDGFLRKSVPIPPGRGPREVSLQLP